MALKKNHEYEATMNAHGVSKGFKISVPTAMGSLGVPQTKKDVSEALQRQGINIPAQIVSALFKLVKK